MEYVQTCLACQRATKAPATGQDQVHYVPIGKPLSVVAIDVVGPLGNNRTATTRGNRYIVTMIDWFSRYVCMYAVPEPTASQIGQCLSRFVARFGAPLTVLSDNANYFKDNAIRVWEERMGIRHAFVSAHRPAGNGLLERFHRTLGRALKIRVSLISIVAAALLISDLSSLGSPPTISSSSDGGNASSGFSLLNTTCVALRRL